MPTPRTDASTTSATSERPPETLVERTLQRIQEAQATLRRDLRATRRSVAHSLKS